MRLFQTQSGAEETAEQLQCLPHNWKDWVAGKQSRRVKNKVTEIPGAHRNAGWDGGPPVLQYLGGNDRRSVGKLAG